MSISELYKSRINDPRWNTSYPLIPEDWAVYRTSHPLSFINDRTLSFYLHIPFCNQLCSFCEYTRMLTPDEDLQAKYLQAIAHDISRFKDQYTGLILLGFDIGGGTPTSLSEDNFKRLLEIYQESLTGLTLSERYEPSIEGTFNTLSENKLREIVKSGIYRLSLGVQSSCNSVLFGHRRRDVEEKTMLDWLKKSWEIGIKKINLDFMYGLQGQNASTIDSDLALIDSLRPQQVTLYELRTNMIASKGLPVKEELYNQYTQYYDGLIALGYIARFGQNTFSLDSSDQGVSSYIRERMLNGAPYKGFGISAQSMCSEGVSYNMGKNQNNLLPLLDNISYPEEFTYHLPSEEIASKYVAISAYNGSLSIERLKELGVYDKVRDAIDFCLSTRLLEIDKNRLYITRQGFKYYGAVFSLIHSPK